MEQTTPTNTQNTNGVGSKIAIIIIFIILLVGAIAYFKNRPNVDTQTSVTPLPEQAELETELNDQSVIDLEADLKLIDQELQ